MPPTARQSVPLLLVALLGLLAGSSGPAAAVDATKPTPCAGMLATDPAGDAELQSDQLGLSDPEPGPPNTDLTGFFLNYRAGADGKKVLTANFVLKDLNRTVPDHASATGGIWYYAHWLAEDGTPLFVKAINNGEDEPTFEHGEVVSTPLFAFYQTNGDTAGKFFEGPDGVVQIDIPESLGGAPGKKLGGLFGVVDTIEGDDDFTGINHHVDSHVEDPNVAEPNGTDYTVTECPADAATPPPAATATPPSGGPTPPPSTPTPAPSGGTTPPGTGKLPLRIPTTLGSARKTKRKKLTFKVRASKPISNVQFQLRRANGKGAPLGTARIANLKAGTSKITLRLKRKLKKGRYALGVAGTVDGQTATAGKIVKLKR